MLDNLIGSGSYEEMKRKAEDRTLWRSGLKTFLVSFDVVILYDIRVM